MSDIKNEVNTTEDDGNLTWYKVSFVVASVCIFLAVAVFIILSNVKKLEDTDVEETLGEVVRIEATVTQKDQNKVPYSFETNTKNATDYMVWVKTEDNGVGKYFIKEFSDYQDIEVGNTYKMSVQKSNLDGKRYITEYSLVEQ